MGWQAFLAKALKFWAASAVTQRAAEVSGRLAMRCTTCAKGALVEIRMRIGGSEVTFRRCGRCEAQAWETVDGPLGLADVLDLARARD
jgi:hypothetical protein